MDGKATIAESQEQYPISGIDKKQELEDFLFEVIWEGIQKEIDDYYLNLGICRFRQLPEENTRLTHTSGH